MKAWMNLHGLLEAIAGPWICFGDFNELIDESEKERGKRGGSSIPSYLKNCCSILVQLIWALLGIDTPGVTSAGVVIASMRG